VTNIVIMCCPGREALVARLRGQLRGAIVVEVWDSLRQGSLPCALRVFELGLDVFKGRPFTVLQDDAEVCQGFADYLDTFTSDVATNDLVIQWYAHGWVAGKTYRNPHFAEFGGHDYVCSLATTYSPRWAEKIRSHLRDMVDHDGHKDDKGRLYGDDAAIADVLAWERKEFFVHIPSLVQHIGHVSMIAGRQVSLQSHDARTSRCYVGEDFDARAFIGKVSVPWRAPADVKEKIMEDEKTNVDAGAVTAGQTDKKIGEMTVGEFMLALHEMGAEKENPVQLSAPRYPAARDTGAPLSAVKFAPNCNECGDTSGDCGHATAPPVKRGQPDSERA